jgi:hypothetical protein
MARVQAIRALESLADASEHHIGAAPLQTPGLTIVIAGFLRNGCSEVEMAIDVGVPNIRAFVDQIRDGHMPIPRDAAVIEAKSGFNSR